MGKNITSNLSDTIVNQIEKTFETAYQGIQIISESFFVLRRSAAKKNKGVFSEAELKALVDMYNATIFDAKMAQKVVLKGHIEDSELYEGILTKWEVDQNILLNKVDSLSEIQVFFIVFEAWNFWYNSPTTAKNLDDFVKKFV